MMRCVGSAVNGTRRFRMLKRPELKTAMRKAFDVSEKKSRAQESPALSIGLVGPTQSPSKRDNRTPAPLEEGDMCAARKLSVKTLCALRVPCSNGAGRPAEIRGSIIDR